MSPCAYVVIPIYNVEDYLAECIESVLSQSYPYLKVILIDDGSEDGSYQIAQSYLNDPRIHLIRFEENRRQGAARNAGMEFALKESRGAEDILVLLDSDDVMSESYIDSAMHAFERHPRAEVLVGGCQMMSQEGELLQRSESRDENLSMSGLEYLASLQGDYFSYAGGGVIKLHFLREKNFKYPEGIINEDLIFGFEVFKEARMMAFFNDVFFYRRRMGSISCAETFYRHSVELLFRSYKRNTDYLLTLLKDERCKVIFPLIERCLVSNASAPISCWIRDSKLCTRDSLTPLLPYVGWKVKVAYYLPCLARLWLRIKTRKKR